MLLFLLSHGQDSIGGTRANFLVLLQNRRRRNGAAKFDPLLDGFGYLYSLGFSLPSPFQ